MQKLSKKILNQVIVPRPQQSYKGTFGKVLLIAGSQNFGGAAIMATTAAVYSGAGLVSVATDIMNFTSLHSRLPEAMVVDLHDINPILSLLKTVNVVAIGPGLELTDEMSHLIWLVLQQVSTQQSLIIDASALTLISQKQINLKNCSAQIILTPHQVEWQRLSGLALSEQTILNNHQCLRRLAPSNAALILKGSPSHIYFNDTEEVFENTLGTPAMATGGMGDTLTGILAGFLAQFAQKSQAILAAAFLHSYIAEQLAATNYVVLPSMLVQQIPQTMNLFAHSNCAE
ncbi:NAD(P)H-hydrate dehydratase [Bombilactobacillus bombi]|uniref:NAD(P)H-hydrate dehydratase n=1 Tax=Bombilactobacillus bombi TaxID=1303590 RepID=UPI0015E62351|nr:NAD(P)H-hydrate dehydratase [Bombilactobacillus bombi]MBA1435090.1 NAD(P)H-hydrate dehydratase [Bombilactobacillus bombi]